jgi:predicted nucleic acid-binding protein
VTVALDTNVLVYAEGHGDHRRCARARELIAALDPADVLLPVQVLGELYNVLTRKAGREPTQARAAVLSWVDAYACADTHLAAMLSAQDLAVDHGLSTWDAVVLAVAAAASCRLLLSEDLQDGFTWGGVTVLNPFEAQWPAQLQPYLTS